MTYETYRYLRDFLLEERSEIYGEYVIAVNMLGPNTQFKKAREKMQNSYGTRTAKIDEMMDQLRYAAGVSQGPDVSEETKSFWGLE
jgi:hypothetical protein